MKVGNESENTEPDKPSNFKTENRFIHYRQGIGRRYPPEEEKISDQITDGGGLQAVVVDNNKRVAQGRNRPNSSG